MTQHSPVHLNKQSKIKMLSNILKKLFFQAFVFLLTPDETNATEYRSQQKLFRKVIKSDMIPHWLLVYQNPFEVVGSISASSEKN